MAVDRTKENPADNKPVNDIEFSEQEILNKSFDKDYNVLATEMLVLGDDDRLKRQEKIATETTLEAVKESIDNLDVGLTIQGLTIIRPTSYEIVAGNLVSGDIISAQQQDNIYLKVGEDATNGLRVNFTFTMPGKAEEVVFRGKYVGSPQHIVNIYAYDYALLDFVMITGALTQFTSNDTDMTVRIPVLNDNFTDVDGTTIIQLRHNDANYIGTHYVEIDYMHAAYQATVTVTTDHTTFQEIEAADDNVTTINYTSSAKEDVATIVQSSATVGATATETFDNSGASTLVITRSIT